MKKKNLFVFCLSFFVSFGIKSEDANFEKINKNTLKSLSRMEQFEEDFLKNFPYFDFKEEDVFCVISYFRVMLKKNGFKKAFNFLNTLQKKYSDELEIVKLIFFYKYVLCYVFFQIKEYSQVNQQYMRIASSNFRHAKNIEIISFLVRDKYYSNESEYSISVKFSDQRILKNRGIHNAYIDFLFELMKISKEYLSLKVLNESLNSRYDASWVESVWYCSENIKNEKDSEELDVFYYVLIEFLFNQDLIDNAFILYKTMKMKFPNSNFTQLASEFFEKKI